jgi:hypothetical protein
MEKLKLEESPRDAFKSEVIQELKTQIGKEQHKLKKVKENTSEFNLKVI